MRYSIWFWAFTLGSAAGLGACQSYKPQPLNIDTHRQQWLERAPASPEVAEFARRLADAELTQGTFDPADGFGQPEAEAVALVYNADLRLARLRAGVTQATAETAGLWEDPVLGTDLTRIIQSAAHPWKVMTTLGFTIPLSGRLEIEKKQAAAGHTAELLKVYQAEWNTRVELRRAWAEWTAAEQKAGVAADFLARLDQILSVVESLEAAGEMPRIEASLFRVERASRRADLRQMEAARAEWKLAAIRLMGLEPTLGVPLVPGVTNRPQYPPPELLCEQLPHRSPALATTRAEYEIAEKTLELEIRKQYPDLMIGPGYGLEEGRNEILLDLSIPLPLLNRNRQAIAKARAERELSRAAFETTYERLVGELHDATLRYAAAGDQRATFESEIVPLVDQQYADSRRVAELGEINTLLLLESLIRQQEAKLKLIDARLAEWLAAIRIDEIVGPPEPATPAAMPATEVQPS